MKKLKIFLFIIGGFLPSLVYGDTIYNIDMDINVDQSGTAHVTEVWNVKASSGTEWYKQINNLGNIELSNFKVTEDGKELKSKKWDVNGSIDEKRGFYGINYTNEGLELCFGKDNFKTHAFTLSYNLENFVFNTEDSQVIYWTLFPESSMNNFTVDITGFYSFPNDLDVWGFGYKGYAYVENGKISLSNEGPLNNNRVVLLAKFPINTFNTINKYNQFTTFDDVLNMAQEGTFEYDYDNKKNTSLVQSILNSIYIFIFIIPFIIATIVLLVKKLSSEYGFKDNKKINKDEVLPFRDIPCNKNIYYANTLVNINNGINRLFSGYKETNIFGAIILKWLREDKIRINNITKGIFNKETSTLDLTQSPIFDSSNEEKLFDYMKQASVDGVLESKELEKWCQKNYSKFFNLFENIKDEYISVLEKDEKIYERKSKEECKSKHILSDELYEESKKLYGLNKFLITFSQIDKKEAMEVKIWDEYLMFAYIFGIADKVAKQFKKLYPEVMENYDYDLDTIIFINNLSYIGNHAASTARQAAENYNSGGGGFSSGGGGFGSFGGGGSMGGR